MRIREPAHRPGVTLVESAIIFMVFLMLILGFMELTIMTSRKNLVAKSARAVARQAIVRGSLCTGSTPWGPETVGPISGESSHPLAEAARGQLAGIAPSSFTVTGEWLDGSNDYGSRVRITISLRYPPMMTRIFGNETKVLEAASTLRIAH